MNKYFSALFFLVITLSVAGQERLTITPQYPQRGERITLQYYPNAAGATIADTASQVKMIFTYSNFYAIANSISLEKKGDHWQTSFVLPSYATYATFYLQAGNQRDQADSARHFSIVVYRDKKRIENSYLYEGYSLPAQLGKLPALASRQAGLYEQELQFYPGNYEAKLRLLKYKLAVAGEKSQLGYRKQAQAIIAAKFYEDPGNMGLLNKTTMGYLIIGENSRLDSIRKVVREKYPYTEAGYELRIDELSKETDSLKMVIAFLKMLKEKQADSEKINEVHRILFEYYAGRGMQDKALHHLHQLVKDTTPYATLHLKKQAEVLLHAGIAPNEAMALATEALARADEFPASLIRYFPETGYIPAFVSDENRRITTATAKGNMLSIIAQLQQNRGDSSAAAATISQALSISSDPETLRNAGALYDQLKEHEKAFGVYRQIAYSVSEDTLALTKMRENYLASKNDREGWRKEAEQLDVHWKKELSAQLKKEMISLRAPAFINELVNMQGKKLSPDHISNKIVVMDFWATWCIPCMQEMPYLQNVYEKYRNDTSVVFMVINSGSDNTLADAQGWWGNKKFSFPVYYTTDRTIGDKFKFNLIPATYIIDKNGNIRFRSIGFEGAVIERKFDVAIGLLKENVY